MKKRFVKKIRAMRKLSLVLGIVYLLTLLSPMANVYAAAVGQFTLTKTVNQTEVKVGQEFKYDLSYSYAEIDSSGTTVGNVVITDQLPEQLVYVSSNENVQVTGNTISYSVGTMNSGDTAVLSLTVKCKSDTPIDTKLNNSATIATNSSLDVAAQTAQAPTVTVIKGEDSWQLDKKLVSIDNPRIPSNGETVETTYQVTVYGEKSNQYGVNLYNVAVEDTLPAGFELLSLNGKPTTAVDSEGNAVSSGGIVKWTIPELVVDGSITYTVKGRYSYDATLVNGSRKTNTVTATPHYKKVDTADEDGDSDTTEIIEVALTPKSASVDLTFTDQAIYAYPFAKVNRNGSTGDSGSSYYPGYDRYKLGETAQFEIKATDKSNTAATRIEIIDRLPVAADGKYPLSLNQLKLTGLATEMAVKASVSYQLAGEANYQLLVSDLTATQDHTIVFNSDQSVELDDGVITGQTVDKSKIISFKIEYYRRENSVYQELPLGLSYPLQIKAEVTGDADEDRLHVNQADLTAYTGAAGDTLAATADSAAKFKIIAGKSLLNLTKTSSAKEKAPGKEIIYTINYTNDALATAVEGLDGLTFYDLVSAKDTETGAPIDQSLRKLSLGLDNVSLVKKDGSTIDETSKTSLESKIFGDTDKQKAKHIIMIKDTENSLAPGDRLEIRIKATIDSEALYGEVLNQVLVQPLNPYDKIETATEKSDTEDVDEDSNTSETYLHAQVPLFVNFVKGLSSEKAVHGDLDKAAGAYTKVGDTYTAADATPTSGYWKAGQATSSVLEGGTADYRLSVVNSKSNGPIYDFVIVDKLPAIGDTRILTSGARASKWTPILINKFVSYKKAAGSAALSSIADDQVTTYYSTKDKPNTKALYQSDFAVDASGNNSTYGINGSDSFDPNVDWNKTPPANITDVTWLMFKFHGVKLDKEDRLSVEWKMKAPVGAPTDQKSTNSFAYGGTYVREVKSDGSKVKASFLPSEPTTISHIIKSDNTATNLVLGNRVWHDLDYDGLQDYQDTNENGIKDEGEEYTEPGMNGVLVLLYDNDGNLLDYTRTGTRQIPTGASNEQGIYDGYYRFPHRSSGTYQIKFGLPKTDDSQIAYTRFQTTRGKVTTQLDGTAVTNSTELDSNIATDSVGVDFTFTGTGDIVGDGLDYRLFDAGQYTISADNDSVDLGLYQTAKIGNYIWDDYNGNGLAEAGEPGLNGIQIQVQESNYKTAAQETYTDVSGKLATTAKATVNEVTADGMYEFELKPGKYQLRLWNADLDYITTKYSDTTIDNQSKLQGREIIENGGTKYIQSYIKEVVVQSGQERYIYDGGYHKGIVGDLIWHDKNADGIQNAGELGVAGITVKLKKYVNDTTPYNEADVLSTKTSTATGINQSNYYFDQLASDKYDIWFFTKTTDNWYVSPKKAGADFTKDSDAGAFTDITLAETPYRHTVIRNVAVTDQAKISLSNDLGLFKPGTISGKIWNDVDRNGQSSGETAMSGVNVYLFQKDDSGNYQAVTDVDGKLVTALTTGGDGKYEFKQLRPGSYYVGVELETAYKVTEKRSGSDRTIDSDINTTATSINMKSYYLTDSLTITSAQALRNIDGGAYQARIGNRVFEDKNGNGQRDQYFDLATKTNKTEPLLAGFKVTAIRNSTEKSITTVADKDYYITDLAAGDYTIRFERPADSSYQATEYPTNTTTVEEDRSYVNQTTTAGVWIYDTDGQETTIATTIALAAGQSYEKADLGVYLPGKLSGSIYLDQDGNSEMENSEILKNKQVTVYLADQAGDYCDKTGKKVTDPKDYVSVTINPSDSGTGSYQFDQLKPGQYTIRFENPEPKNYQFIQTADAHYYSSDNNSDIQTILSDGNGDPITGRTPVVSVLSNTTTTNINAGFTKAELSGVVFNDYNGDGQRQDTDSGISGVPVRLIRLEAGTEKVVANTSSDAAGNYRFTGLDVHAANGSQISYLVQIDYPTAAYYSGKYMDDVSLVDGKQPTAEVDGFTYTGIRIPKHNDTRLYQPTGGSRTTRTQQFSLIQGSNPNVDAGFYDGSSISGRIWNDRNYDGIQNQYISYDVAGNQVSTAINEEGIAAVTVELYRYSGATLEATPYRTTTTSEDGSYVFNQLPEAKYVVVFANPDKNKYVLTKPNQGSDKALDSNADSNQHSEDITISASNKVEANVDAGFYRGIELNGSVWVDGNSNGTRDPGDSLLNKPVSVKLWQKSGTDLVVVKDIFGQPIGTTTTSNGKYQFSGIPIDSTVEYVVEVVPPSGYRLTTANVGDDQAGEDYGKDSQTDSDMIIQTGQSESFHFVTGELFKYFIDAGLIAPVTETETRPNLPSEGGNSGGQPKPDQPEQPNQPDQPNPKPDQPTDQPIEPTKPQPETPQPPIYVPDQPVIEIQIIEPPKGGTVTINEKKEVVFTPNSNFDGSDKIIIKIIKQDGSEEIIEIDINDEGIAKNVKQLPKTGGIPLVIWLGIGFSLIGSGIGLSRKKGV